MLWSAAAALREARGGERAVELRLREGDLRAIACSACASGIDLLATSASRALQVVLREREVRLRGGHLRLGLHPTWATARDASRTARI